jgi:hypothetical protein
MHAHMTRLCPHTHIQDKHVSMQARRYTCRIEYKATLMQPRDSWLRRTLRHQHMKLRRTLRHQHMKLRRTLRHQHMKLRST